MNVNPPNLQLLGSGLPKEVQQGLRSALSAQDQFNHSLTQTLATASTWTWVYPQLLNGWVDFSTELRARYTQLSNGLVVLAGCIKSGTINTNAFVLPVNLWPDQYVHISPWSFGQTDSKMLITPVGEVQIQVGSTTVFAIDCSFLPAQVG